MIVLFFKTFFVRNQPKFGLALKIKKISSENPVQFNKKPYLSDWKITTITALIEGFEGGQNQDTHFF